MAASNFGKISSLTSSLIPLCGHLRLQFALNCFRHFESKYYGELLVGVGGGVALQGSKMNLSQLKATLFVHAPLKI